MQVKPNQLWERREPKGTVWDRVKVIAPSPMSEFEVVVSPENVFAGDSDEPQVVAVSATTESLEEHYLYVEDVKPVPVILGETALEAFGGLE